MKKIENYFLQHQDAYLKTLGDLVNTDSHSDDLEGISKVADQCHSFLTGIDKVQSEIIRLQNGRSFVKAQLKGGRSFKVLIIGHMDTVFEKGTAQKRPFQISGNLAYGSGVADMKAGVTSALYLLKAIAESGTGNFPSITLFLSSDEETGSGDSKKYLEELALENDAVLVFEPGRGNGDVVTGRKGIGRYKVVCKGIAAHAGTNHQDGKNAIVEIAHKILTLAKLTNYEKGTTVNAGTISGGTGINVVPDHAEVNVDLRFGQLSEVVPTEKAIAEIVRTQYIDGVTTELHGGLNRPPMEETEANLRLYDLYCHSAREFNYRVGRQYVGGGSDGNITCALGVPTLDGLGPCGAGFHSDKEYMELDSIIPRLCAAYVFLQNIEL
ncbi:MAG: M20 family metallopeptidase [Lachnospiraceae bacterium]